jgi:uncharacterized protein YycO
MRLLFTRRNTIGSYLIRAFTWSQWSHCVVVESDSSVIDSTFAHGGVCRRPLASVYAESSKVEAVDIPLPDEAAAIGYAVAQIGKPYDWKAVVGFILHRNWADDSAWFCNELAEACLAAGGKKRFREEISRITPRESWMVIS